MSLENPDLETPLILPNPEQFRKYGQLFFIQVQIDTTDLGSIEEKIKQAMQIEHTLAAFCKGEISLEDFFDLSEIFLEDCSIDDYVDEVCDSLGQELQPLILPYEYQP